MLNVIILTNPKTNLKLHVVDRGVYAEVLTSDEHFLSDSRVPFRRWYYNPANMWVLYKGKKYFMY